MTDFFQDVDTTMVEVLERIESILRFSSTAKKFKSCTLVIGKTIPKSEQNVRQGWECRWISSSTFLTVNLTIKASQMFTRLEQDWNWRLRKICIVSKEFKSDSKKKRERERLFLLVGFLKYWGIFSMKKLIVQQ